MKSSLKDHLLETLHSIEETLRACHSSFVELYHNKGRNMTVHEEELYIRNLGQPFALSRQEMQDDDMSRRLHHSIYDVKNMINEVENTEEIDFEAYKEMLKSMPQPKPIEKVEEDQAYVGIFKIKNPYALFSEPNHCYHTAKFINDENPPNVMTTGKVFKVKGRVMAAEIIIAKNDEPRICWIHYHNLEPITKDNV